MSSSRRLAVLLAGLLASSVACPKARADGYEETETRLKLAGVDEPMRERIHESIRRGVAKLRGDQWRDGSIYGNAGQTALAGLALRHAAIPEGVKGGRRAIRWLLERAAKATRSDVYTAGLAAMLLAADRSQARFALDLHARLTKGPNRGRGYWTYKTGGDVGPANLSTAQFACLGLWSGERLGAETAERAWRTHLDALLVAQRPSGSWGYLPLGAEGENAGRPGYPTGTFMGLANLLLAREALAEDLRDDPELGARVRIAEACGMAALRRHTQWTLGDPGSGNAIGVYPYYRLYALEKACVFLGVEDVGGIPWYREGAALILSLQAPDGSWTTGVPLRSGQPGGLPGAKVMHAQYTSFALLFLLRSSEAYHPVTPRSVDAPPVTTPGEPSAGTPERPGPPPALPIPLTGKTLDAFERLLDRKRITDPRHALDAFRLIPRIYPGYRPDGEPRSLPHDLWCQRAEALLLRAAGGFRGSKANDRLLRQAIALGALDALGFTSPRVEDRLRELVERMPHDKTFPESMRLGWYGAAFDALRRVRAPGLRTWLLDFCLDPDPDQWARSSAALTCLGGIDGLTRRKRYETARAVVRRLRAVLERSGGNRVARDLHLDVATLLSRLASRPRGGDRGGWIDSVSVGHQGDEILAWWRHHGREQDPFWRE